MANTLCADEIVITTFVSVNYSKCKHIVIYDILIGTVVGFAFLSMVMLVISKKETFPMGFMGENTLAVGAPTENLI